MTRLQSLKKWDIRLNVIDAISSAFKVFQNSFFPSTVIEWNKLDPNLSSAASLGVFKKNLLKFMLLNLFQISKQLEKNQIPHKFFFLVRL